MKIDIHAHVLPGVDDGAKDWGMCLDMLEASAKSGVTAVIATPHFLPWRKSIACEEIKSLCTQAREKLDKERGVSMDIYPGNEIYYSIGVVEKVKEGSALTLADSRYVLVEFKTAAPYQELCRAVREFRDAGYIPIIAHMERYQCLNFEARMEELKETGALFQMNISSLQGGIFDSNKRKARKLILDGAIDFLASDMHDLSSRPPFSKKDFEWIQNKIRPEERELLLSGNAERILM